MGVIRFRHVQVDHLHLCLARRCRFGNHFQRLRIYCNCHRIPRGRLRESPLLRETRICPQHRLDFVANGASSSLQSNLMGSFNGISLPWPGKLPAGCDMLTKGDCPLAAAEEVTLALGLMIESFFPPIKATARWELLDDSKNKLVCLEVPLKLK